jgi:hypothetical protein
MASAAVILAQPEQHSCNAKTTARLPAAKKYQFITRAGTAPKFWVFKARV